MKAWRVHELGDPKDVLKLDDVEEPEAKNSGEAVVEVEAAALNFFDILMCRGEYQERPELPFSPGGEVAGTVDGRRVIATPFPAGGYSGKVVVSEDALFPIPDSMPFEEAAAMHIIFQTAHFALHRRASLKSGETVLLHAGAGGVGSAAIQLAKAANAKVIATAGGKEKVEVCRKLGADLAIDYREDDFIGAVKEATDGRGADVVFDPVGGDIFDGSRRCVAFEGRIVIIGFAGGRIAEAPTNHALIKNYSVVGLHWGLYNRIHPELVRETHDELMRLYEKGDISPLIHSVVPFEDVPDALVELGGRKTYGKLVTKPG
ncbi:MAG: NADPH:quinone oxidoreductase family protein [Actinomycetota bacterium]|nr:NADPH:quinone oxidoreductase family protein [Actinomycetota bacterium]